MIDTGDPEQFEPFLQSTEGRRIVFFLVLLVLVAGGLVYALLQRGTESGNAGTKRADGTSKRLKNARKHWKVILRKIDRSGSGRIIFAEPAYQSMYDELDGGVQHQLSFLLYQQKKDDFTVDQFFENTAALRGSVVPFRGRVVKKVKKIPVAGEMTVWELWVRHPEREVTYRVHLLKPPTPGELGEKGTRIEGEGVFLTLRENQVPGREEPISVPVIMCHNVRFLNADQERNASSKQDPAAKTGDDRNEEQDVSSGTTGDAESRETDRETSSLDWRKIPAPKNYEARNRVVSYWGKLLASLPADDGLPRKDPLYHRLLRELERVKPATLDRWAREEIRAEWLTDPEESRLYRGDVIPFKGQYVYGRNLNVPGTDRTVWEFWLRDQEKQVTYTIHSFTDVNFRLEKGDYLKGEGLYLQSPEYALNKPGKGGETRYSRTVFMLTHGLEPAYPNRRESMAAIDWFELLLGGLFVVFLVIFIVMVFMTTRNEAGEKTRYLRELREGRKKSGTSGNMEFGEQNEDDDGAS